MQVKAAERLGINRNTLHKKLDQFKDEERAALGETLPVSEPAEGAA